MSKDYSAQLRNEQNGPSFSPRHIEEQNEAAEKRQEEKDIICSYCGTTNSAHHSMQCVDRHNKEANQ